MKRQLNLICVLIFFSLGLSLVPHIYLMGEGFVSGFKSGLSQARNAHDNGKVLTLDEAKSPLSVSLLPTSFDKCVNKIFNQKTGEWLPAQYYETVLWVQGDQRIVSTSIYIIVQMVWLFAIIWAVVSFYKLINAINHQVIFEWINVRRLNHLGIALLIAFIMTLAGNFFDYLYVQKEVEISGYTVNVFKIFDSIHLILGLMSLLVGRIFAMGITLREEQELTI